MAVVLALGLAGLFAYRNYRAEQARLAEQRRADAERWMREYVIPNIRRLIDEKNFGAAFDLAEQAEQAIADDPTLAELRPEFTHTWSVTTDPPGADVAVKLYDRPAADWRPLGRSPLERVRLPLGFFRWRVTKEGFTPVEGFREPEAGRIQFALDPEGNLPPGMVRVAGNANRESSYSATDPRSFDLEDYLIDRYEVTNRQFKEFVDQGGYGERKYWKHPFRDDKTTLPALDASTVGLLGAPLGDGPLLAATAMFPGRADQILLSWDDAMRRFHDQTGQPGPSTWRSGTYPAGEADYPVQGVSWHEAAAYAEFAGKSLPTVAHWVRASGYQHAGEVSPFSNFLPSGSALVGKYQGLGPFGTSDMAGNVKEWCWNTFVGDKRYILGGSWNEPAYMFARWDTASAFNRSPTNGFRCVRYLSDKIPPAAYADFLGSDRDFRKETPVSDELFQVYKSMYTYDKNRLNDRIVSREDSAASIHQTITFDAAYGKERVIAHLYLPRQGKPPYQVVLFFPGANYFDLKSFPRENPPPEIAFLVRSGRAVLWPVYKGSCERWVQPPPPQEHGRRAWRELAIQWYQDLARSLDYLQERSDLDQEKVAYYGLSRGGVVANIHLAVENRIKVGVLVSGGLLTSSLLPYAYSWNTTPETSTINFVSRVRVPLLMLNGCNDPIFPLETSQQPMYRLLGTPLKDKRHILYDVPGHSVPQDEAAKETLAWLDQYLGKVH